ncbi:hypothetical protein ACFRJ9_14630 [Paenarthrobacter sp. NPDC056912]|uniref:hypothetical protein n=1 Tax=Paenarthrobacter sp. NPDC056912 TaxID=3345965 RepID=UPI003671E391
MKKQFLVIGSAVVVSMLLLLAFWIVNPLGWGQEANGQAGPTQTASPTPSNEQEADAQAAAEALSRLTESPSEGISAQTRQSFNAEVALPAGSKLAPEVSTWAPDGIGGGTMNVVMTVPGQADSRYVAVMVKEDGAWKLLGTMEQKEGAETP